MLETQFHDHKPIEPHCILVKMYTRWEVYNCQHYYIKYHHRIEQRYNNWFKMPKTGVVCMHVCVHLSQGRIYEVFF